MRLTGGSKYLNMDPIELTDEMMKEMEFEIPPNIETKEKHLVYNSIRNILNDNYYLSNYSTRKYIICDMEGNQVHEWVFLGLFPFKTKAADGTYYFEADLLDKDCVRHVRLDDSMNVLEGDEYE